MLVIRHTLKVALKLYLAWIEVIYRPIRVGLRRPHFCGLSCGSKFARSLSTSPVILIAPPESPWEVCDRSSKHFLILNPNSSMQSAMSSKGPSWPDAITKWTQCEGASISLGSHNTRRSSRNAITRRAAAILVAAPEPEVTPSAFTARTHQGTNGGVRVRSSKV